MVATAANQANERYFENSSQGSETHAAYLCASRMKRDVFQSQLGTDTQRQREREREREIPIPPLLWAFNL
jgi:hypothetical protein